MSSLRNPEDMDAEQLALTLRNIKILETWIKSVRKHAHQLLTEGGKIPGFKLGYGMRRRIWKEGVEQQVIKLLLKEGIKVDEIVSPPELITPAQVEKVLKMHGLFPRKQRGQAVKPATIIDPYLEKSTPELKVVPDTGEDEMDEKFAEAVEDFT